MHGGVLSRYTIIGLLVSAGGQSVHGLAAAGKLTSLAACVGLLVVAFVYVGRRRRDYVLERTRRPRDTLAAPHNIYRDAPGSRTRGSTAVAAPRQTHPRRPAREDSWPYAIPPHNEQLPPYDRPCEVQATSTSPAPVVTTTAETAPRAERPRPVPLMPLPPAYIFFFFFFSSSELTSYLGLCPMQDLAYMASLTVSVATSPCDQ